MSKMFTKKSLIVMAVCTAIVLIASLVLNLVLGVNYSITQRDYKTLTVTVDDYYYRNELSTVESVCQDALKGVDVEYKYNSEMSGDGEIVYVFETNVDTIAAKEALETALSGAASLDGAFISVSQGEEKVLLAMPATYLVKAVIATAVFAVLAFAYVALRYNLNMGIMAAVSALLGGVLSGALVLLVRIPVTTSIFYVTAISSLLSTVFTLLTFNKLRANLKSDEFKEKNAGNEVVASVAWKEVLGATVVLGVSLVLVGAIATWNVRWFALMALVGLLCATFVGLLLTTALYVPMFACASKAESERSKNGYVGAKKNKKKAKKEVKTEVKTEEAETAETVEQVEEN